MKHKQNVTVSMMRLETGTLRLMLEELKRAEMWAKTGHETKLTKAEHESIVVLVNELRRRGQYV